MPPPGRRRTALFLVALAAACGGEPGDGTSRDGERDGGGPEPPAAPERIVSLVPSATAALLALGAGDRLVARTDFDTARALAPLPSVGGGLQPSLEVLLSLSPDLVVRFAGESDPETPRRLDEAGIPHLAVRPERIEDVREMIRTLGRLTGRVAAADSILGRQRHVLDSLRALTRELPRVTVAFTLGGDPPYVAGSDTFVGELLDLAGGENVFADLGRPWAGVSPETVLERSPELLLTLEGSELDPRLTEGRRVARVPDLVQLPGPDLHRAALAIARAVRPEVFGADGPDAGAPSP